MIRATTGGVLKSYRSNLMNSFIATNKARDTVLTQRTFNSYAEDPASAAKAFRLRNSRMTAHSQYNICSDTYHKYQAAWDCLESISLKIDNDTSEFMSTLKGTDLKWLNDPTGDAREQLGKVLDQVSEAIIQNLNQTYGDNFIFAGADGHNVPFEIREMDDGTNKLYYRGVPVDAAVPDLMKDQTGKEIMVDDNGEISATGTNYLSAHAKLVQTPESQWLLDGAGNPILVDPNRDHILNVGDIDSDSRYILATTPPLSDEEYTDMRNQVDENGDPVYTDADFIDYTDEDGNTRHIYKNSEEFDTMAVSEYQDILANAMTDADNGSAPYVVTKDDGTQYYIVKSDDNIMTQDEYDAAVQDAEKLEYLMNEKLYVDIGLGFQENEDGNLIPSSAFNAALIGPAFLGYGVDEDGDPKNIYSLVQKMKELCDSVPEGGSWDAVWDDFDRLVGKLENASSDFKTAYTNFDAGTTKLKSNLALLEDNFYNLQEEYGELEDVDMADAITSFIWAQYCYNAALKVGNSVLSESLMDYLS